MTTTELLIVATVAVVSTYTWVASRNDAPGDTSYVGPRKSLYNSSNRRLGHSIVSSQLPHEHATFSVSAAYLYHLVFHKHGLRQRLTSFSSIAFKCWASGLRPVFAGNQPLCMRPIDAVLICNIGIRQLASCMSLPYFNNCGRVHSRPSVGFRLRSRTVAVSVSGVFCSASPSKVGQLVVAFVSIAMRSLSLPRWRRPSKGKEDGSVYVFGGSTFGRPQAHAVVPIAGCSAFHELCAAPGPHTSVGCNGVLAFISGNPFHSLIGFKVNHVRVMGSQTELLCGLRSNCLHNYRPSGFK